jgi:hypothetical protein
MAKPQRRWVWVKALAPAEKAEIAAACERFITKVLKPRFLPEVHPTRFNYPVDILGKWRGNKYSFITRYRSGFSDNLDEEFDSALRPPRSCGRMPERDAIRRDVAQAHRAVVALVFVRDA